MPAKYRQGDRLRMSRTQIQFVYGIVGNFEKPRAVYRDLQGFVSLSKEKKR